MMLNGALRREPREDEPSRQVDRASRGPTRPIAREGSSLSGTIGNVPRVVQARAVAGRIVFNGTQPSFRMKPRGGARRRATSAPRRTACSRPRGDRARRGGARSTSRARPILVMDARTRTSASGAGGSSRASRYAIGASFISLNVRSERYENTCDCSTRPGSSTIAVSCARLYRRSRGARQCPRFSIGTYA